MLRPVAFLLAEKMGLSEDMQMQALTLTPGTGDTVRNLAAADDVMPADVIVLIIDLAFTAEDALMLLKSLLPPDAVQLVQKLEADGERFGVQNPKLGVLNGLMKYMSIDNKDIALIALEKAIRKTDAFAVIQLDESYIFEAETPEAIEKASKHVGPVETMEGAVEGIMCLLETEGLVRMVTQTFDRDVPKTGKISNFGKVREMTDEPGSQMKLTGRFTHLFDKIQEQPKPAVSPSAN